MTGVIRKQIQTLEEECPVLIEAEIGVCIYKSKNTRNHWQKPEARKKKKRISI